MKNKLIPILLIITLISGCVGQPIQNQHQNQTNTSKYTAIFGEPAEDEPHEIEVKNSLKNSSITVTVSMFSQNGKSIKRTVTETIKSTENATFKLQTPTKYKVTISNSITEQYIINKTSFDCNYKLHRYNITSTGINTATFSTAVGCLSKPA